MRRLGVVAALPNEARTYAVRDYDRLAGAPGRTLELDEGRVLLVSGVGPERATAAARALVEQGIDALVSWGTAGALGPDLRNGDLVLPPRVRVAGGEDVPTDAAWVASLAARLAPGTRVHVEALVQSDVVVDDAAGKARLHREAAAIAVDMESGALGAVAREAGVAFVAVRAVCDTADMAVPRSAKVAIDGHGRLQPLRLLRALAARPVEAVDLWRLDRGFRAARRTLLGVVAAAGPRLALPDEPAGPLRDR